MTFDFETPKNIAAGRSTKWQKMDLLLGRPAEEDTIPMWIAQADFQPAPCLQTALHQLLDCGEYGYFDYSEFGERVSWWYKTRHGWRPDPAHVFATHGIGNAVGLTLQSLTEPGDGIIIFSPVYHEFSAKIRRNGRVVVESPLVIDEAGLFRMDLKALEAQLTGNETAVLFCSPHNPAGRVWEPAEIQALSSFCARHDLLLFSDEIHMDLTFGSHQHTPTAISAPDALQHLVVMSAASKTFDIAGLRTGYVIIPDETLRDRFASYYAALDIQPNRLGSDLTCAAYTPEGAAWVDALMEVLDDNRVAFCDGMNAIPGVSAMPMQATFLAWVDFTDTGMSDSEIRDRLVNSARIVSTPGPGLGIGGAGHHRFNIAAPRATIDAAIKRISNAFSDLQ